MFVLTLSVWRFLFDADQRLRSRTTSKLISRSFREVFDGSKIVDRMEGTECGALSFRLCWQVTSKQGRHWSREGERGDLIGPRYAESTVVSLKDVIAETHSLLHVCSLIHTVLRLLFFSGFFSKEGQGVCQFFGGKKVLRVLCWGSFNRIFFFLVNKGQLFWREKEETQIKNLHKPLLFWKR